MHVRSNGGSQKRLNAVFEDARRAHSPLPTNSATRSRANCNAAVVWSGVAVAHLRDPWSRPMFGPGMALSRYAARTPASGWSRSAVGRFLDHPQGPAVPIARSGRDLAALRHVGVDGPEHGGRGRRSASRLEGGQQALVNEPLRLRLR